MKKLLFLLFVFASIISFSQQQSTGGYVGTPGVTGATGNVGNLTGDVVSVGNATTLSASGVSANTYGSATTSPTYTVDLKGRITNAANVTITPAIGSVTGLGTGVATALGVNIGSAGAPVTNGGALGTPSSGVATNLTGAPSFTSLNKYTFVAPATSATVTVADGKAATINNTLTFAGTDGQTMTFTNGSGTVATTTATATLSNKTLTTPTIADFTNATHNHTNAAGGGQITTAALSDYVGTTSYISSSTVVGLTSKASCSLYYSVIGSMVYIEYVMSGTTNATTVTFTLPFACQSFSGSNHCPRTKNNGGAFSVNPGGQSISASTVTLTYDMSGTQYTSGGAMVSYGEFWYFK